MKKSLKVLFFGNERIATGIESVPTVFTALLESNHTVVGLVVHLRDGSGRKTRKEPIIDIASGRDIPVLNPLSLRDSREEIKKLGADVGVLVAYGKIIPEDIIDLFPYGIINLHPSLLPKLRGSTPVETALLEGQPETGVSIMEITKAMDAGDVYAQKVVPIAERSTKQELANTLHKIGADMILATLDHIESAQKTPQKHSEATFTSQITKDDSVLDLSKSADQLDREIRAFYGWPGSWTTLGGLRVKITSARVESIDASIETWTIHDNAIFLRCGDGQHLRIDRLQPENKKEMPVEAFLAGYSDKIKNS